MKSAYHIYFLRRKRYVNNQFSLAQMFDKVVNTHLNYVSLYLTAQKMKFCIKDFSSKCDQIRRKLSIWSHLLEKSFMENFSLCAVSVESCLLFYSPAIFM